MSSSSSAPAATIAPRTQNSTAPGSLTSAPVDIHPSAYIDPHAYTLGTFPITIGANVIVHPRAFLVSTYGPLIIGAGTVLSERCIIGGPRPTSKNLLPTPPEVPVETVVGRNVIFQAAAEVGTGSSIDDACLIEPHAVIKPGVKVGKHSKVCAGCTVDRAVGEWTVVWADGQRRRGRAGAEEAESGRLKALEREREATARLLLAAAAKATFAKRNR